MSLRARRTASISLQELRFMAISPHRTRFSLMGMTISRRPDIQARSTQRQYTPS